MRIAGCSALLLVWMAGVARAQLPPGFARTALWLTPGGVACVEPLPDGRVLAAALYGPITLVQQGQAPIGLITIADVVTTDEHGVLGLTIDPGFSSNGWFYVLYTGPGPYNLVARYTLANSAVDPASRVVIWQNPGLCPGASHQGGAIHFGPDGNLYIATGDQYDDPSNAQTLATQHGKILRLAADGSIPPDNPFVGVPGAQAAIWAYGLRNPFRGSIDGLTGNVWIGDVGGGAYEEIDRGAAGANYGWPLMEGPLCSAPSCSAFTAPVSWYAHGDPIYTPTGEAALICGPIYRGTAFPSEYRGNLFYADFVNGWMKRLVFDQSGAVVQDLLFDAGPAVKLIVDLKLGQDGALYYAVVQDNDGGPAGVYRIAATQGGNVAPVVVTDAQPRQGNPVLNVQFSSTGTLDPDAGPSPLSYLWEFGDGQTSTVAAPLHGYGSRGFYQARLTVSDGADPVTSAPMAITVGSAPVPVFTAPAEGFHYAAGDTIFFAGTATDTEDGVLPAAAFTWTFSLVHLNHEHPILQTVVGAQSGSFVIPVMGHDPEHTHYRIELTVRDSDGIPATVVRDLVPWGSALTLDTAPSGIPLLLDGRALATPQVYESLEGFHHQISAQETFVIGGLEYVFERWSNQEPRTFNFVSPEGGLTFTAVYRAVCYANCDGSAAIPVLNANDFNCFLNKYAAGDAYVNCDGSTLPPVLNANDFLCFLNSFAAGCS